MSISAVHTLPETHLPDRLNLLGGRCLLLFADILFIEAQRSYTVFWCRNKEFVMTSKPLGRYESSFPDYLVRIHKSYVVNLHDVVDFDGTNVQLSDGRWVGVSRRRRSLIRKLLSSYSG